MGGINFPSAKNLQSQILFLHLVPKAQFIRNTKVRNDYFSVAIPTLAMLTLVLNM